MAAGRLTVRLEGFHAVKHALRFGATIRSASTSDRDALLALAADLAPDLLDRLAELVQDGDDEGRGVVAEADPPSVDIAAAVAGPDPVVFLEHPTRHGNVGAVVRVASAAGAAAVLTSGTLDPWHANALRGAAGLHYAVPVARIDEVPASGRPLVAFDPAGEPLTALPERPVLAFGSERRGLSCELMARADRVVAIPMRPGVSSLNLATAVAVALYAGRLAPPPG